MTRNVATSAWLLPLTALAPFAFTGCSAAPDPSGTGNGVAAAAATVDASDDAAQKSFPDSGMKMAPDSAMKMPPMDDASGPAGEGGSSPPGEAGTPPGGDASTTPPLDAASPAPDAGQPPSTPGSVTCNGAPCDVSHGYFCCVTPADGGVREVCKPPNSTCGGFRLDCDERADCALGGICCQDFPSVAVAGSATCKAACPTQICRTDDECCPLGGDGGSGRCIPQQCSSDSPPHSIFVQACSVHGFSAFDTLAPSCMPMLPF
ncbi:MAG TPA: hypothetical protein VKU41_19595 [Polyangiaceae bacterium]|nr:hypothetical protein [Polyangiaceae bacterium]